MRILLVLNHPAHVHLFRNFIYHLQEKGHHFTVATRDKDITHTLLDHYGIEYHCLSKPYAGIGGMFVEMLIRDWKLLRMHRKYGFDIAFGTDVSTTHLTLFKNVPSYTFCEDDDDVVHLYALAAYPFTTKVVNPVGIRYKYFKNKRLLHNSYHELAYLHPDFFTPDEAVIKKYGFSPYTYIIIRNSALKAHHDIGAKGLSGEVWDRVNKVIKDYPQITSHEGAKSQKIEPWDMHHVLAFSKMIISDSLSMSVEAAVLGVPAIRYNSFVGRVSVLNELENKYDLTYGFNASDSESATAMIYKIEELLAMAHLPEIWQEKRQKMLSEKINFTTWMIDLFNNIVLDKKLCK
jgi:hypothetical protein